jgi:hypothetical protein
VSASSETAFLRFTRTALRLEVDDEARSAFAPVLAFFRHSRADAAGDADFSVSVRAYDPAALAAARDGGEEVAIRRSSAPEFDIPVWRRRLGDGWLFAGERISIRAPASCAGRGEGFELGVAPGSTIHGIEFLRDLVIRHEELRGTVVLHAAAVTDGSGVVAIAGAKAAGKTTTLLAAARAPGWRYFSGDKLFCARDGAAIACRPWRDYPYVGVGTARSDPDLLRFMEAEAGGALAGRGDRDKVLLDPERFERFLGADFRDEPLPLAGLLLPAVAPGAESRVRPVDDPAERWSLVNQVVERSCDTTFFTWQSYLVPDYAEVYAALRAMRPAVESTPTFELAGGVAALAPRVLRTLAGRRPAAPAP